MSQGSSVNASSSDNSSEETETSRLLQGLKNVSLSSNSPYRKSDGQTFSLNPDTMIILCGVFIVCVQRLRKQGKYYFLSNIYLKFMHHILACYLFFIQWLFILGSPHTNMAEVFLVSVLLTLINHVNSRLEQRISLIDPSALDKLLPAETKVSLYLATK